MAKTYPELTEELIDFIRRQKVFFVASAPQSGEGYANLSPKGYPSLAVLDSRTLAYADYPGSGNKTAAHAREGSPVTMMFCSFDQQPMILRIFGRGEAVPTQSPRGLELLEAIGVAPDPWIRQVIVVRVEQAETSCGYGVPLMEYQGDRPKLLDWCRRKAAGGNLAKYMG